MEAAQLGHNMTEVTPSLHLFTLHAGHPSSSYWKQHCAVACRRCRDGVNWVLFVRPVLPACCHPHTWFLWFWCCHPNILYIFVRTFLITFAVKVLLFLVIYVYALCIVIGLYVFSEFLCAIAQHYLHTFCELFR